MNKKVLIHLAAAAALAAGLAIGAVGPAQADGGGHSSDQGSCSMKSTWELKASPDGNKVRVEVRVDTGHSGQLWDWSISDNATVVASGQSKTKDQSDGRFEVQRRIDNLMGRDSIDLSATNAADGETCMGHVVLAGGGRDH
jgi:hypothetical protein